MLLGNYTSGGSSNTSYNVTIVFQGSNWSEDLQQAFIDASEYISTIITGDVADFSGMLDGSMRNIDDIEINATLDAIDGPGGTLGQAGPTYYRTAELLPITGEMTFDVADAQTYYDNDVSNGTHVWNDIVLHEMLHVLGFGTMWSIHGLVSNIGTTSNPDYRFTGQHAQQAYQDYHPDVVANDPNAQSGVPIESDTGLAGTDGGHWDETLFQDELMTGFVNGNNSLSMLSIASLEDLGYETIYTPPCFCAGSLIATPNGCVAVEDLKSGDLVDTLDHGPIPIRCMTVTPMSQEQLETNPRHRPVVVRQGAFGVAPDQDLYLSPQHRVLVQGDAVKAVVGEECLVPIKDATQVQGIRRTDIVTPLLYYHIVFPIHAIVRANSLWVESYLCQGQRPARVIVEGKLGRKVMRKMRGALRRASEGGPTIPNKVQKIA